MTAGDVGAMEFGRQTTSTDEAPYLVVENLSVQFPTHDGLVQAVTDLSYTVRPDLLTAEPGHQVACHLPISVRHSEWATDIGPKVGL